MNWAVPASAPSLLVSDTGRVIRMASSRRRGKGWQTFSEVELRPRRIGAGYLGIQCKLAGQRLDLYVHRLVAEAFHGIDPDHREVNHIDGNKTNNHASNLEWVTHSQNHQHAALKRLSAVVSLTPEQVRSIKERLRRGETGNSIARRYGVSRSLIYHIKSGRSWGWLT